MAPGRLVLHVGSHKTATTLVQRWLLANGDALRARGVDYPNLREVVPGAVDFTQWDLFAALAAGEEASRLGSGGLEPVLRRLEASTSPVLLLSAENCWGLPPRSGGDYFVEKDRFVEHVVSTLKGRTGRGVEVVAWLRRPDQYLLSLFNQAVKQQTWTAESTTLSGLFAAFAEQHLHLARYDQQLAAWEAAVGESALSVNLFDADSSGGGPLGEFVRVVGIDATGLPEPEVGRVNRSWSAAAVLVKAEANRQLDSLKASRRTRRVIEHQLGEDAFGPDTAMLAAPNTVGRLQERLATNLVATRRRLGDPDSWSRSWEPEATDAAMPTDTLVQLAARLVLDRVGVLDE